MILTNGFTTRLLLHCRVACRGQRAEPIRALLINVDRTKHVCATPSQVPESTSNAALKSTHTCWFLSVWPQHGRAAVADTFRRYRRSRVDCISQAQDHVRSRDYPRNQGQVNDSQNSPDVWSIHLFRLLVVAIVSCKAALAMVEGSMDFKLAAGTRDDRMTES